MQKYILRACLKQLLIRTRFVGTNEQLNYAMSVDSVLTMDVRLEDFCAEPLKIETISCIYFPVHCCSKSTSTSCISIYIQDKNVHGCRWDFTSMLQNMLYKNKCTILEKKEQWSHSYIHY